jgi:flavin-dependent dehydrogenase
VGKVRGAVRWEGFFREASGPGWVLTGDAGHFKSPAPGRGIGDAFLQAESLSGAIVGALAGSEETLDRTMERWGRRRDREFAAHYWLAGDFEDPGLAPALLVEILRRLHAQGQAGQFFELLNHRLSPNQLLTPPRILGATARLLAKSGGDRRALLSELRSLSTREARRRWLNRRPDYAPRDLPRARGLAGPDTVDELGESVRWALEE